MLQRSVPGKGLGLAVWGQPKGLRTGMLRLREWNAMAEGTLEVWGRKSKMPLSERARAVGAES